MSDSAGYLTIDDGIAHYRSLDLRCRRELLALLVAGVAATDDTREDDPWEEHETQVLVELFDAVQLLSSITVDLMYDALFRAVVSKTRLQDICAKLVRDLRRRTRKPRWKERDAVIVRLRDEEGMTFGQIGQELRKINREWGRPDGRTLSYKTVKVAYHRRKNSPANNTTKSR
jgi:hypothetical protein